MGMMLMGFLKLLVLVTIALELELLAHNGWRAVGADVEYVEKEREALLPFKAAFGNDSSLSIWSSWGRKEPKKDCCQWEGVVCNNQTGHVIKLYLSGDSPHVPLKGEIHASLMELQYLMYLDLSNNNFYNSSFPEFLGSLRHLTYLDLHGCGLGRGNIPSQLGHLSHLQHLDLSMNWIEGAIPFQLGNLSQLQYLDLSWNLLEGVIPFQLGNLSNLQALLLYSPGTLKTDQDNGAGYEWLSGLTSLGYLELGYMADLKYSHKWLQMIEKVPNLKRLSISNSDLSDEYILSLPSLKFNSSSSLSELDFSWNDFKSSIIFHWILNISTDLIDLDLQGNHLEGPIPYEFARMMNSLESLDLGYNHLKRGLNSQGHICTLRYSNLGGNLLSEELSTILQNFYSCARSSLQLWGLSENQINGTLVDLSIFPSLKSFYISENLLNGTITEDFRFPSSLVSLDMHSNALKGTITNSHLANMRNLKFLDFSDNWLTLTVSHDWIPPFQLEAIYVRSCKLGPDFPKWLQTQNNFVELDISNNGILGIVPQWFWGLLTPRLRNLNVSCNNISGTIPNVALEFVERPTISLASNRFEGSIPPFLRNAVALFLSNNSFSKVHMFLCANWSSQALRILDLSDNQLYGRLPDCWTCFKIIYFLDLSNNNFSGGFPISVGSLQQLKVLILRNNGFTGELPITLRSCSNLALLDVGGNKFFGHIPSWIGNELKLLQIVILRNNNISGSLSTHLCYLSNLHFLDLSLNILSGPIPRCFKNFTQMAIKSAYYLGHGGIVFDTVERTTEVFYDPSALLLWKGQERIFKHHLLVKGIHLSNNKLTRKIPPELGMLVELISLNLSRNQLDGEIPLEIGQLTSLDSLDLSRNHLFGSIPSSLAQIDRLAVLDLSYNNLSGKIPTSTQLQSFNSSSYEGNLRLCGKPLEIKCPREEQPQKAVEFQENNDSIPSREFYWSMGFGFIIGFWGTFGPVLFNRSWRHAYFTFLKSLTEKIDAMLVMNVTKCKRCFRVYLEKLN